MSKLSGERQFRHWLSDAAVPNTYLTSAGLSYAIRQCLKTTATTATSYYKGVDPEYLPGLLKEARERGTPRLKALLVSLALQGKIQP